MRFQLISWPQTLIEFEFIRAYEDQVYIDLPMVQSWLQIHKDTLKCININQLSLEGKGRLFDARGFLKLEELQLSRWMMSSALDTAKEDAELLLGPKLRKFVWDFDAAIDDGFREDWTDFADKEEECVRSLALVAIERGHPLQEIYIEFTPENMGEEAEGYPWDRMDRLHEEVQPFGLKVRYNEPVYTRDEWMEEIQWQREWRMHREL